MEFTGIVKEIFKTDQVSEKFRKREFVITNEGDKYPQDVIFQLTQSRCELADKLKVGDEISVFFNLKGKKWNDRYFNSLEVWKINGKNGEVTLPNKDWNKTDKDWKKPDFDDDLPF